MINITKAIKKLGVIFFINCISINSFAKEINTVYNSCADSCYDDCDEQRKLYDNKLDYLEEGNDLTFKMRGSYIIPGHKSSGLPSFSTTPNRRLGKFTKEGIGVDAATTLYFNDKIAAELSLGFYGFRVKRTYITSVIQSFGGNASPKLRWLYLVPVSLLGQYHITPYGGIDPYIGIGYHGTFAFATTSAVRPKGGVGPVFQLGVNLYAKDDSFFTFDIRQFILKTKLKYKPSLVNNQNVKSTIRINPLVISVGYGVKF